MDVTLWLKGRHKLLLCLSVTHKWCVQGTAAGWFKSHDTIFFLCVCVFFFSVQWNTARCPLSNATEEANRQCDELELNDYLTVILARVGTLEYKVRHERPRASSLARHTSKSRQASDTELPSDPQGAENGNEWLTVLLKSLRLPTRALPPACSLLALTSPYYPLLLSLCDLIFRLIGPRFFSFFFSPFLQLAGK